MPGCRTTPSDQCACVPSQNVSQGEGGQMADESQFEQNGAKLLVSMGMFAVAGPGTLLGAVGLISSIVGFMTSVDSAKALNQTQQDIVTIKSSLIEVGSRLDELVDQVAIQSNRQTLARLHGHLDEF